MRDIRKPYRSSRSSSPYIASHNAGKARKEDTREVAKKTEMFEKNEYREIDYTKDGSPIMKASSHFDMKGIARRRRGEANDFDVLKREAFFNNNKREFDEEDVKVYKKKRSKKKMIKRVLWYSFLLLIIGAFFAATFFFDRATITVNPKYKDVDVSGDFLIFKEDMIIDTASSSLSKTVLKSAPKQVNQKATGEIIIYNNYSTNPQILIKNTRFQTSDGKVFRISNSVTVPGKTGTTPGTIKATVSADSYGADYNIPATEFTIPGFKGTARYNSFYAKSTSAMKGGMSGVVQTISQDDIDSANKELKSELTTDLSLLATKINHPDYFTLANNILVNYTDNQALLITSNDNSYELTGVASIISIKKDVLAKMIAKQVLGDSYDERENVRLDNIDNLVFTLDKDTDLSGNILKVNIVGRVRIIWAYNSSNVKLGLVGKSIATFDTIMKNYDYAILASTCKFTPFWLRHFPSRIDKIKIVEEVK